MKRLVKALENVVFVIAVFVMICSLICQFAGLKPVVVMSGSMEPTIGTGSLAFIDTNDREVFEGDIISFRAGDILVTHRVIDITNNGYRTKGDNNEAADVGIVKDSNIEGKILFSIPGAGYFLKTVFLPAGIVALLLYVFMKVMYKGKIL